MSREELTDRQAEVLAAIKHSIRTRGFPPTNRELRVALRIKSSNGVADHLRALEKKGKIRRSDKLSRGIEVLEGQGEPGDVVIALRPGVAAAAALALRGALVGLDSGTVRALATEALAKLDAALGPGRAELLGGA